MSHNTHIPIMLEFTPQSDNMRHQQTVFKGADGDILRTGNKHGLGLCEHCRRTPPKGKRFRRCTGCMTVMYCSETCQRAAWRVHNSYPQTYLPVPQQKPPGRL
ncbi:hypothetical protein C8Q80DRAFT_284986 [Daedaleopsis nitida]|nr:hypothetical protein C8Q80DRAFT_284986 [Daedaleopsis nitida]